MKILFGLGLFVLCNCFCTDQPSCFIKHPFAFNYPSEGFYTISITNISNLNILAYADINGDLRYKQSIENDKVEKDQENISNRTDFVAQNIETMALTPYIWNQDESYYFALNVLTVTNCSAETVYLYDVNDDGFVDITIWGTTSDSLNCLQSFQQKIISGAISFIPNPIATYAPTSVQPFLIQYLNGPTLLTGLLGMFQSVRSVQKYESFLSSYITVPWGKLFMSSSDYSTVPIAEPHWAIFVDMTGDCFPDLLLRNVENEVEFWIYSGNSYILNKIYPAYELTNKGGAMTSMGVADMNNDGSPDLVVTSINAVNIWFNIRKLFKEEDFCCEGCETVEFVTQVVKYESTFEILSQYMQLMDLNLDGYPEIIVLSEQKNQILPIVLLNKGGQFLESYDLYESAISGAVGTVANVSTISLIDILENRIIDFNMFTSEGNLITLYSNQAYENVFSIKGGILIGPTVDEGAQLIGSSIYWINSIDDGTKVGLTLQLSQTGGTSLQMPYCAGGLGRANNYVESFTVAGYGVKRSWSPIIPNSQLAIFTEYGDSNNWKVKVLVLPSQSLVYVIITSIILLLSLGGILVYFKFREFKQKGQQSLEL